MTAHRLAPDQAAFPRLPLLAAAGMLAVVVVGAGLSRLSDIGRDSGPAPSVEKPSIVREMHFVDRDDGGIDVLDARTGAAFDEFAPGENGFARATLRGLVRDRKRADLGAETPFRLSLWRDGRLVLDDPATGRHVDLRAFGATNREAFARLLPDAGAPSQGDPK